MGVVMERMSDPQYTASVYLDVLDRLERLVELLEARPEWEVDCTHWPGRPSGDGWEPFAGDGTRVYWRRRL